MKFKHLILSLTALMWLACNKTSQTKTAAEEDAATAVVETAENIITTNKGQYPREFGLFEDEEIVNRLKFLVGDRYDEMVANFNVETPVVTEDGIYKVTGCKQHECPNYHVTILFDAVNDNMNVLINQDGKIDGFGEKASITMTETLELL